MKAFLARVIRCISLTKKEKSMANTSNTPYDDVFRTLTNDCPKLVIPVSNELFKTAYTGQEIVVKTENEIFLHKQEGEEEKRITDTSLIIKRNFADREKAIILSVRVRRMEHWQSGCMSMIHRLH